MRDWGGLVGRNGAVVGDDVGRVWGWMGQGRGMGGTGE